MWNGNENADLINIPISIRVAGSFSRSFAKKSFKIDFFR